MARLPTSPPLPLSRHCPPGTHVFTTFIEYRPSGFCLHRCVCTRCGLVV